VSALAEPLFLFDGDEVEAARAARGRGGRIVAFSESAAGLLTAAAIPFVRSVEALGDDPEMPLYRAAADWTQQFGTNAVDASGQTLKDALRYRDTTLWWWAELYLHHNTEAVRRVRFLETVGRVIETFPGSAIETHGLTPGETTLAERFCAAHSLGFKAGGVRRSAAASPRSALSAGLLEASKVVASAMKGSGGRDERLVPRSVVFVSHAAFWKSRTTPDGSTESYEHYFDSLLGEARRRGLPIVTLGVGPQSTFRTRSMGHKWRERLSIHRDERFVHINRFVTPKLAATALKAFGNASSVHRRFKDAPSLNAAFSHRGVSFADLSPEDLARTLLHQVPWAARTLLEFDAAFRELDPRLVCLYAESSGLGRAALEAARPLKVQTLGVQHGILYPNYFSYERTREDVALGTPIPDVTATYGNDGVRLLETGFRYPKDRVVATGSPRYDALAAEIRTVDREKRRKSLGVDPSHQLVVLASRYSGIRQTHKASGPAFSGLIAALGRIEGGRLIVKPHPAEPAEAYDKDIADAALGDRVRVISDQSLAYLLPAADLLVTVESLSATEALVAGVPVVVLRHPSNLRDLVASGAAIGVPDGEDPGPGMQALLTNSDVRDHWRKSRDAFLVDAARGVDGRSLDRLVGLVSKMAGLD
jgi:glycosyltransferase involved in cell wall biosynthesis